MIAAPHCADTFAPGDHGSTFAGGPVACAAANAALDVIDDEAFLAARARAAASGWPRACASCPASCRCAAAG